MSTDLLSFQHPSVLLFCSLKWCLHLSESLFLYQYQDYGFGERSDQLESDCNWSRVRMSFNILERENLYC